MVSTHRSPPQKSDSACRPAVAIFALALVAVAFSGCGADGEDEAAAVRALIDREVEAMNKEDLQALSEIWAQDSDITLIDVPPPGRFQGWDRIARVFNDFFDRLTELQLEVDAVDVKVTGDAAYATYEWSLTGRVESLAVVDRGQATAVYRKRREGWRLVHAHYSPVPPALALEAEAGATPAPDGGEEAAQGG